MLIQAGAYAPVAFIVWHMCSEGKKPARLTAASAFMLALGIEGLKLFLVDERPDPTNLLIAAAAATLAGASIHRLVSRWEGLERTPVHRSKHEAHGPGSPLRGSQRTL